MSDSSKAVFLSYASQDAEAAKRICESLRQAGVEVWFSRCARSFEFGVLGLELADLRVPRADRLTTRRVVT